MSRTPPSALARESARAAAAAGRRPPGSRVERVLPQSRTPEDSRLADAIAALETHDHVCLIYRTPEEYLAAVVPFLACGLRQGERCILIAESEEDTDTLTALRGNGIDVDAAMSRGQLVVKTQRETYLLDGVFDPDRMIAFLESAAAEAKADGFTSLRVTGDVDWALGDEPGCQKLMEYESRLGDYFPTHDCLALCRYDANRFPPEMIRDAIRTHPIVICGDHVCRNPHYIPPKEFSSPHSAAVEVDRLLAQLVERQQADETLRENRDRLAAILDSTPVAMIVVDEERRIRQVNRAAADLGGQSPEAMVNKAPGTALCCLHALRNPKGCGHGEACHECIVRQTVLDTLTTHRAHRQVKASLPLQGALRGEAELLISATPVTLSGRYAALVCIEDVSHVEQTKTELRESEEKFRLIVENANDIIYTLGLDGRFTYISPNFVDQLGFAPTEFLGRPYAVILHPDDMPACDAFFKRVVESGENARDLTYRVRHKHHGWRWHTSNASPLRDAEGNIIAYQGISRDITESRFAAVALQQSERNKTQILDSTIEVFSAYDRDLRIQWANRAFCEAVGVARESLLGRFCYEVWHHADEPCLECAVLKAMETGNPQESEHTTADGRVWCMRGYPMFDDGGHVVGAVEFGQNITERRQAEEELRRREELLDEMGRIARIGGWEHDLITGEARWTRGTFEIVEIEPGSPIPGPNEHLDYYPPESKAVLEAAYQRAVANGEPFDVELRCNTFSGRTIWARAIGTPVFMDGQCVKVRGTFQDITARKKTEAALRKSEQRMELALIGADLGTWDWIFPTGVVVFNERWAEMLGHSLDDLTADVREWEDRVHPDDMPRVREILEAHLRGETDSYEAEFRMKHKSGRWVWILDRGRVIERDEDGKPLRVCGTHLDITERRRSEELLKERGALLESVGRMAKVGGWELDTKTNEVRWTDEVYRIHEVPVGQKPSLDDALEFFHPDDRDRLREALRLAVDEGLPYDMELRFITANGRRLWTRTICRPVVVDGSTVKLRGTFQDITELKQAEHALKEAKLRQESAIKAGNIGLWDWDLKTNSVFYSAEWKSQIGYQEHEIGEGFDEWRSRVHPDDLEPALRHIMECIDRRESEWSVEFRFRHRDGTYRWILAQASVICDDDGNSLRAIGTHIDITEQKQAEERLRFQSRVLDQIEDTVTATDLDGIITYVNDAECRKLKQSRETLIGQHISAYGEDPNRGATQEEIVRRTLEDGHWRGEVTNIGADGTRTVLDCRTQLMRNEAGVPIAMCGIGTDITERKEAEERLRESEERYRVLVETAADAIFVADPESGRILEVNHRAEELTGRSREELLRLHQWELHPPEEAERYASLFQEAIEHRGHIVVEVCVLHADGRRIPVEISSGGIVYAAGRKVHVGIFRDVSERQQTERARRELEEQLRQSQKLEAVGQLAAGVAHDFNNLITAITGYADLLRQAVAEGSAAEQSLDGIEEAARQASGVTRSLLMFSSRVPTRKKRVELRTLVEKTTRLLRRIVPASVSIVIDPSGEPPVWLDADETQLQQLIMNLAVNARDAMPDGGTLRVSVREAVTEEADRDTDAAGQGKAHRKRVARLIVSDTGCGIPAEIRHRVFEPFYTTKPREHGTGLGLSIVHGIVQEHDGTVEIDSTPDKGTIFTITLPIDESADHEDERSVARGKVELAGELVLLAEDNWNVRSIVGTVLHNCGFEVEAAVDGASFMERFEARLNDIRLLVLDVDLPRRSGRDCLRDIRARGMTTPAIVITGSVDETLEDELDENSVLLHKPFSMPELQRLAADVVSGRRNREGRT